MNSISSIVVGAAADAGTVLDLLRFRAGADPDRVGYTFLADGETPAGELSYVELDRQARAIAVRLAGMVAPGARALMQFHSDLGFIAAFAGCLYAGVIAVPAPLARRNRPIEGLLGILEDSGASVVLSTAAIRSEINPALAEAAAERGCVWLATDTVDLAAAGQWRRPEVGEADLAFLQYTSGSTGAPKGVMVSHGNLMHNQGMIADACGHSGRTVTVAWLPMFHDMGLIGNVLQPLYLGAPCIVLPPATVLQKPLRWLRAITRYRGTTSGGPNFIFEQCASRIRPEQMAGLDLSSWALAFNGSEPVRAGTLARFADAFAGVGFQAAAFHPCYGLAEATLRVCGRPVRAAPLVFEADPEALERNQARPAGVAGAGRMLVGCGPAVSFHGASVAIVEPASQARLPPGEIGEIWIKGPNVAQGYWRQPEATARTFEARLEDGDGPYLRSGDLGFVRDSELFVSGRLKDVLVVRGRNIHPSDVETVVQRSSDALEADRGAAFLVEIGGQERLVIAQEVRPSQVRTIDAEAVRAAIRESVARHFGLGVHQIVLLGPGGVPRTTSGKVRRRACREHFLDETWPAAIVGPVPAGAAGLPGTPPCEPTISVRGID